MTEDWVRASEIGEYVYCHRAWWLRHVQGVEPANAEALRAGRAAHGRHARDVERAGLAGRLALGLLILAALLLAAAVLLWWLA